MGHRGEIIECGSCRVIWRMRWGQVEMAFGSGSCWGIWRMRWGRIEIAIGSGSCHLGEEMETTNSLFWGSEQEGALLW